MDWSLYLNLLGSLGTKIQMSSDKYVNQNLPFFIIVYDCCSYILVDLLYMWVPILYAVNRSTNLYAYPWPLSNYYSCRYTLVPASVYLGFCASIIWVGEVHVTCQGFIAPSICQWSPAALLIVVWRVREHISPLPHAAILQITTCMKVQ